MKKFLALLALLSILSAANTFAAEPISITVHNKTSKSLSGFLQAMDRMLRLSVKPGETGTVRGITACGGISLLLSSRVKWIRNFKPPSIESHTFYVYHKYYKTKNGKIDYNTGKLIVTTKPQEPQAQP